MKKNVLTGALAAREYIHVFRDPIGCMRTLHRKRCKIIASEILRTWVAKAAPMQMRGPALNGRYSCCVGSCPAASPVICVAFTAISESALKANIPISCGGFLCDKRLV